MARYIGPKSKIARKFREPIFGPDKYLEKKNYPPGIHGLAKKRMKQSEYAIQLQEKQKVKYTYGILERQFKKTFDNAARAHGVTGEVLLQLIESRLDNVVYRLGLANTRAGARQMVLHRHITLNGIVTNIPSATLRAGDIVAVRGKSRNLDMVQTATGAASASKSAWLQWNPDKLEGVVLSHPTRDQIPENINEQLIVELYSK